MRTRGLREVSSCFMTSCRSMHCSDSCRSESGFDGGSDVVPRTTVGGASLFGVIFVSLDGGARVLSHKFLYQSIKYYGYVIDTRF